MLYWGATQLLHHHFTGLLIQLFFDGPHLNDSPHGRKGRLGQRCAGLHGDNEVGGRTALLTAEIGHQHLGHGEQVGASDCDQYVRKADGFYQNLRGAHKSYPSDGTPGVVRYTKNGKYLFVAPDGKFKIYEDADNHFSGYSNLQVIDSTGTFYCAVGYGKTETEALEDTICEFLKAVDSKTTWEESDFSCSDPVDF